MNGAFQGLRAHLPISAVLFYHFIYFLCSQFCLLHRANAQGKKIRLVFLWVPPICGYCTEFLKSSRVFISALLQGTDWLLEESERMLHSCIVQDAQTVGLWVKKMSMAEGLDLPRPPVYVEGHFRASATEWILGEAVGFYITFPVCSFLAQRLSQFWKKASPLLYWKFLFGDEGQSGSRPPEVKLPQWRARRSVACVITCFVEKLGILLCHSVNDSLW